MVLLKEIVVYELVDAKRIVQSQGALWKLSVFEDSHRCSNAAVEFLVSFLRKHELSSSSVTTSGTGLGGLGTSMGMSLDTRGGGIGAAPRATLREKLLDWLCLSLSKEIDPKRLKNSKVAAVVPPYLAAVCLLALFRSGAPPPLTKRAYTEEPTVQKGKGGQGKLRRAFDEDDFYHFGTAKDSDGAEFRWLPHAVGKFFTFGTLGLGWIGLGGPNHVNKNRPSSTTNAQQPISLTELKMVELEHSRALYSHSPTELRIGASEETKTPRKPLLLDGALVRIGIPRNSVGKNHISVALKMRLQNLCVQLFKEKTETLLEMGANIFGAEKRKTLGVNKEKLSLLMTEMVHLCHVIVELVPLLLDGSSGSNRLGDMESPFDEAVFLPLLSSCMAELIGYITENILSLATHPTLLGQVLTSYEAFVMSWKNAMKSTASKKRRKKGKGGKGKDKEKMDVDDKDNNEEEEESDEEEDKEDEGERVERVNEDEEEGEETRKAGSPLAPYFHNLHPLTQNLLIYLRDYAVAAPSLARVPVVSLTATQPSHSHSSTAPSHTVIVDDLDLLDMDMGPSNSNHRNVQDDMEEEEEGEEEGGNSTTTALGREGSATFTDENVTLCVRIVGKSALYSLCESERDVGKVLLEVLQSTHNIQLKFEILHLLLDLCPQKDDHGDTPTEQRLSHSNDKEKEKEEEEHSHRLGYVIKAIKVTDKLSKMPELFGQDIVRRHLLWVLQRLINLLNPKVCFPCFCACLFLLLLLFCFYF